MSCTRLTLFALSAFCAALVSCPEAGDPETERPGGRKVASVPDAKLLYFYSPGCPDCREVTRSALPTLEAVFGPANRIDVETPDGFADLQATERRLGLQFSMLSPVVVADGEAFVGLEDIVAFSATLEVSDNGGPP